LVPDRGERETAQQADVVVMGALPFAMGEGALEYAGIG
jgi:hypothetical protein